MDFTSKGSNIMGETKHFLHNSISLDSQRFATDNNTREFVNFSSDALQKSYDQIQQLKSKNESQREIIRDLEQQLQNLESSWKNIKTRTTEKNRQCDSNNIPSSKTHSRHPKPVCTSRRSLPTSSTKHNVFTSKIELGMNNQNVKLESSKAGTSLDQEQLSEQNKKENLLVNCAKLKDIAVNSNRYLRQSLRRNLRQSFLRHHPSELQLSLRAQLDVMYKEKQTTIDSLKVTRKQKQSALNTLMGTIEVHSQTLQHLMQQKIEEEEGRNRILSPKIEKFKELNESLRQLEEAITYKIVNVEGLQVTNCFLTVNI